jgi:hypothetical protein
MAAKIGWNYTWIHSIIEPVPSFTTEFFEGGQYLVEVEAYKIGLTYT